MHIVATTFVSINTSHIKLSVFPLPVCFLHDNGCKSGHYYKTLLYQSYTVYAPCSHRENFGGTHLLCGRGGTVVMVTAK